MTELENILTRKQQARLRRDTAIVSHNVSIGLSLPEQLEAAHIAAALVTTGDSPGSGMGERVNTSGHSDPTLGAVLHDERINAKLDDLRQTLLAWHATGIEIYQLTTHISKLTTEVPHKPPAGSGECLACGEWVPGVEENRIKAELCPADYTAWRRAGKPDRVHYPLNPDRAEGEEVKWRITWAGRNKEEEAA